MQTSQKDLFVTYGEELGKEESQQENKLQVWGSVGTASEDLEVFLCSVEIEHLLQTGVAAKMKHQTSRLEGCRASLSLLRQQDCLYVPGKTSRENSTQRFLVGRYSL